MDDIDYVKKITHFYYCLLVSLKMRSSRQLAIKKQEHSRTVKKWLKNAKDKKLFDPLVCNEVDWLVTEVDRYSPVQFEERINKIYCLSKKIIQEDRSH